MNAVQLLDPDINLISDAYLTNADDFYGFEDKNSTRPAIIYRTVSGYENGNIVSYPVQRTRSLNLQAFDYFGVGINSFDSMIKADNA